MKQHNVMIVDDSTVDRQLMKMIIEEGVSDVEINELEDAIDIVNHTIALCPKVIILDLILKDVSGLEALKLLKEHPLTSDIPIIIFSGMTDADTIKKALDYGAYDFFEKPLSANDIAFALSLKVNNALKLKLNSDHMNYLRNNDLKSGLFTRTYLENYYIQRTDSDMLVALVLFDINGLKVINDVFGYHIGDEIILNVAKQLQLKAQECLCVAKWGSDEFAILMDVEDEKDLETYIDALIDELQLAHTTDYELSYGYSMGVTRSSTMYELVRTAEEHLSSNKVTAPSSFKNNLIKTIINTLHHKNPREEYHSKRVSEIAEKIACAMDFSSSEIQKIKVAGLMHDIGKIGINESILNKVGGLEESEWLALKKHPEIGFRILSTSLDTLDISNAVLAHHERWDGKGYPQKLSGHEIPLMARIISVADAYDAMTSFRTYRKSLDSKSAVEEIASCSGTQFDPDIVKVFQTIMVD